MGLLTAARAATTLGGAVRQGAERLRRARVEAPRLTAETLLAHALGRDRAHLYAHSDVRLDPDPESRYAALIERRAGGEPTHQLTGSREFFDLDIEVNRDVLTPRPETEFLVEEVVARAPEGASVLDLGCGSGCVAVAAAAHLSDAKVFASDVSRSALEVAARNGRRHGARVAFVASDWLSAFGAGRLDVVVSNPPYIAARERAELPLELTFEPEAALFGGEDGLAAYRRLIPEAATALRPGGLLLLELGADSLEPVRALLAAAGFRVTATREDLAGIERVVIAEKPLAQPRPGVAEEGYDRLG